MGHIGHCLQRIAYPRLRNVTKLQNRNTNRNLNTMSWHRNMFQMKEEDKTPEEQLSKVEIANLPKKRVQCNDRKDDTRTREKNGCIK